MAIHFKFRSAVEYDSIDIDGPFISIGSLKEKIVEHKNLGRATDFDLLITNAQTAEGNHTFPTFLEVFLVAEADLEFLMQSLEALSQVRAFVSGFRLRRMILSVL